MTWDGIGLKLGETTSDYGNGYTIRDMEFLNVDTAISLKNNCWLVRGENIRGYNLGTGIFHNFSGAVNSGANIVYTNCVIFNSTHGFHQTGTAADGWHVQFIGSNLEHCDISHWLEGVGDGTLDIVSGHFEGNNISYIKADSGYVFLGPIWMFSLSSSSSSKIAFFDLSGTAQAFVSSGRIGFAAGSPLARMTASTTRLVIDQQKVITPTLFATTGIRSAASNVAHIDSTASGPRPSSGSVVDHSEAQYWSLSSTDSTLAYLPAYNSTRYRVDFQVHCTTAGSTGSQVRIYLNPGSGGASFTFNLPNETGVAYSSLWVSATDAFMELRWTGATSKLMTASSGLSHSFNTQRAITAVSLGDSTLGIRNLAIRANDRL